jgi:hypothetical protein
MPNLTVPQLQAIKQWMIDNPLLALSDGEAANNLNLVATPTYKVWRTTLGKHDYMEIPDVDGAAAATSFALGGGTGSFINRSQQEQAGWVEMWNSVLACKPYLAFTRIALFDIFSGAGANAQKNRTHFWARGQMAATVVQKLLATATVGGPRHTASDGNAPQGQLGTRGSWENPDTLGVGSNGLPNVDPVTAIDCETARRLP